MEYNILKAFSPADLIKEVNDAIKDGWQPLGGPIVVVTHAPSPGIPGQTLTMQAVVRERSGSAGKATQKSVLDQL
jgi:hypothetical protein